MLVQFVLKTLSRVVWSSFPSPRHRHRLTKDGIAAPTIFAGDAFWKHVASFLGVNAQDMCASHHAYMYAWLSVMYNTDLNVYYSY